MKYRAVKHLAYVACLGIVAAAAATPAAAADMPRPYQPSYKAAPVYIAPFTWTGFYVGVSGGYGWGRSNWTNTVTAVSTGDFDINGALVSGTVGYNLQTGTFVWGLEGDFGGSWIKGTDTATCGLGGCETRNSWLGTGRGRIGYAWNRWLPFVTGGAAFGDIKMSGPLGGSETKSKVGWTAGGGVEYAFSGPWSAKVEYLYVDLGTAGCGAVNCGADFDVKFKTNLVRAGVNYRF